MTSHPEPEEKNTAPDSGKLSDSKATDNSIHPSKTELVRSKLKFIANYAMRGFASVVAVPALVIAVIAVIGNQSSKVQIAKDAARIDKMSASLLASKGELEKFKAAMAKEKAVQEEERKKQNARATKVVQNVTQLQVKLKILPTLEEQLLQPANTSAVTPSVASAAAPATATVSTSADKKPGAKVQAIKDAIEKFNKK